MTSIPHPSEHEIEDGAWNGIPNEPINQLPGVYPAVKTKTPEVDRAVPTKVPTKVPTIKTVNMAVKVPLVMPKQVRKTVPTTVRTKTRTEVGKKVIYEVTMAALERVPSAVPKTKTPTRFSSAAQTNLLKRVLTKEPTKVPMLAKTEELAKASLSVQTNSRIVPSDAPQRMPTKAPKGVPKRAPTKTLSKGRLSPFCVQQACVGTACESM